MGFFLLLSLTTLGLLLAAGVMAARAILWIVLLPFRIVFGLLFLPFWLAKAALKLVGLVIFVPLAVVAGGLALIGVLLAALLAVAVPLLPILIVGGLLWAIIRSFSRRPAAV
jgi:hypothetical protein